MLFRRRRLARAFACFFLLETLLTVFAPGITWAVSGPGQPEFTSYESPGSTDMVNLTTGDLTYNLPVLDIPGPERGISIPLTYRAGIKLEQEASWVGLGWSLNPGAIARSLTGYPDDISNQPYTTTFRKEVDRGWYGSIVGVVDLAWNSETGHSGSVDLIGLVGVSWAGGRFNSVDLIGVKYTRGEGISMDPVRMAMAYVTLATAGTVGPFTMGANLALGAAGGVAGSMIMSGSGRSSTSLGKFNQMTVNIKKRNWIVWTKKDYERFYNDVTTEKMFGSLYFRDMSTEVSSSSSPGLDRSPTIYRDVQGGSSYKAKIFHHNRWNTSQGYNGEEMAADMHQNVEPNDNEYKFRSMRPLSIAHDQFSVMGADVSGSIRPQLLEVGSLAVPRRMLDDHDKYSAVSFLDDYKIPFRYEGSFSNGYDYHQYTPGAGTNAVGIDQAVNEQALVIKDPRLMELAGNATTRTAPARKGIRNATTGTPTQRRGLDQGKHVAWYTNAEIIANQAPKLLEGDPANDTNQPGAFRLTLPSSVLKGIGAFAVTSEDGTTYHYSLPVYHLGTYSYSREKTTDRPSEATTRMGSNQPVYATTWALTAITSSDYVDRGQIGVVDAADWGGWVKFTYGRFGESYKWRQPYIGTTSQEGGDAVGTYSEGARETYYLNTIQTRTHTALFVKSVRNDARGHFGGSNLNISESRPASSLRLDEIVLLTNADWKQLQAADGIREAGDSGAQIPALTTNTASNASTWNPAELATTDSYASVLDGHDLEADNRIRTFVNDRALKRVKFNYSYRLCDKTPNSFASATVLPNMSENYTGQDRTGKLTLESVSLLGPQSTKLVPDYRFTYGYNPNYGKDKWDGFGMYNRAGTSSFSISGHAVSTNYQQASEDAAAWSLTSIMNPLGGLTTLHYERDQYAHTSEYGTGQTIQLYNNDNATTLYPSNFSGNLTQYVKKGDKLWLKGQARYMADCIQHIKEPQSGERCIDDPYEGICEVEYARSVEVKDVGAGFITIDDDSNPLLLGSCVPPGREGEMINEARCPTGSCDESTVRVAGFYGQAAIPTTRTGGDLRVAMVTTSDGTNEYQVRYRYTVPENPSAANSAGVLAQEPTYVERSTYPFEKWFDYPTTPVMYKLVTVLRGVFKTNQDADHDVREVYAFHTPESSMIIRNADFESNGNAAGTNGQGYTSYAFSGNRRLERINNHSIVNLGRIGQPIRIERFNNRGEREFVTSFGYNQPTTQLGNTDNIAGQGRFTEGVMTNEMLEQYYYRINRSTKEYAPTVMTSSTTIANGMRVDNFSDLYDFFTGQVVESHAQNSLGQTFVNRTTLAYTIPAYASMGLKSADGDNANMLTQTAAAYVFKRGAGGALALLSGEVQTWKNSWSYRQFNTTTERYEDVAAQKAVWRMHESYVWNGAQLNADGTKAGFVAFNWNNISPAGQHADWLRTSEMTLYNQYSQPLESRDMNGRYASSKAGNQHTVTMATAQNARYSEFVYSGAEDQLQPVEGNTSLIHFGGEVGDGNRRTTSYAHAGVYSSLTSPNQRAFTYHARVGTNVTANRKYRLAVWVRGDGATPSFPTGAKVYASLNGTRLAEMSAAVANTKKAGEWYLMNLYFDLTAADAGKELTVGCENTGSTTAYFDDFRFQPLVSSVTAYNFDPHTGQTTHALDNDNLFTRYEYDRAGKLLRVYRETLDRPGDVTPAGGRKIKEYAYNYARNRTFTVQATASGSGQVTSSVPGGTVNQVEVGGSVRYTGVPNSCQWYVADVLINGASASSGTLSNGTIVSITGSGCELTNVQGSYNVTLVFGQHTAVGTVEASECEICLETGRATGRRWTKIADGCGGYTTDWSVDYTCLSNQGPGFPHLEECPSAKQSSSSSGAAVQPAAGKIKRPTFQR